MRITRVDPNHKQKEFNKLEYRSFDIIQFEQNLEGIMKNIAELESPVGIIKCINICIKQSQRLGERKKNWNWKNF